MQSVRTCRWATPTLDLPAPVWLDAWRFPWTCTRGGAVCLVADTDVCHDCSHWESIDRIVDAPSADGTPRLLHDDGW